ncbi:MAG: hypothetical protein EAZ92_10945 [Candidatus Kapaibacterium sp.]|nr:MAG: hypothetical protein EAZ92_10945 [Candidatus Kapabacteria bacterium]
MFTQLLRRFASAMALVAVGLASMIYFMKFSKPADASAIAETTNAQTPHKHASSEDHKQCAANLTGKNLPATLLQNTDKTSLSPAELSDANAVIVIRYLGYSCSHCIEQLLALQKLTDRLKSARVKVIAFSDDTPEQNLVVLQKYEFDPAVFSFAFDPAKSLGRSIGAVYTEEDGAKTELHVSMVVRKRRVEFAHFDTKPMMDVEELLRRATAAL